MLVEMELKWGLVRCEWKGMGKTLKRCFSAGGECLARGRHSLIVSEGRVLHAGSASSSSSSNKRL